MQNPTTNTFLDFFNRLYSSLDGSEYLEIRYAKTEFIGREFIKLDELQYKLPSVLEKISGENNCYFGVATRRDSGSGKKENCITITALFADIDVSNEGHKKGSFFSSIEDALEHIQRIPMHPTMIVNTGHGLHLYWVLSGPITLDATSRREVEDLLRNFKLLYGGDSVDNIDRILRIPGTYNRKCEPHIPCEIIEINESLIYTLDEIKSVFSTGGTFDLPLNRLSNNYYNALFGIRNVSSGTRSRSEFDQSIITNLITNEFSDEQIRSVFKYFPTTGKYFEKQKQRPEYALQYLNTSIANARGYLATDPANNPVHNTVSVMRAISNTAYSKNSSLKLYDFKEDQPLSEGNLAKKFSYDQNNSSDIYSWIESGIECGYYSKGIRLSNFIVKLTKQISSTIDSKNYTFIDGEVTVASGTVKKFENGSILFLSSGQRIKEFLLELCGVETRFLGNPHELIEAIKLHNALTEKIQALDYGYTENLDQFVTPHTIIDKSCIIEKENYMLYNTQWQENYLQLQNESQYSIDELKTIIIEKLIPWDEDQVSLLGLGFTFLPLIYPHLRRFGFNKPYMLLTGDSGSGKSTMLMFFQRFYGTFNTLFAISSTATSVEIMGHSMKDSLIGVDDLKLQILNTENKRNNFITMLQNYSDNTSRNRANINLEIRDRKNIRGVLMISGEDYVISEASSIARGILINVNKKEPNMKGAQELQELSKNFSYFTSHYLQYLMQSVDPQMLQTIQTQNINWLERIATEKELVGGNLPRIINNFAQLKTSWDLFSDFLFAALTEDLKTEFQRRFETALASVFEDNFERVHKLKTDLKFEEILWTLVENNTLIINNDDTQYPTNSPNVIGRYKIKDDNKITLGINLRTTYKHVQDFMKNEGGVGLTYEVLIERLTKSGKITAPKNGQLTVGKGKQFRGHYWIGEIPYETLGIPRPVIVEEKITRTIKDEKDILEIML